MLAEVMRLRDYHPLDRYKVRLFMLVLIYELTDNLSAGIFDVVASSGMLFQPDRCH